MASVHPKSRDGRLVGHSARWRDPDGTQHSKLFNVNQKRTAKAYAVKMEAAIGAGTYVSPSAGKTTFKDFAESWRSIQVHRARTARSIRGSLEHYVYPRIGHRPLAAISTTELQTMVKAMSEDLAPSSIETLWKWTSTIFKAAVTDGKINRTPCTGVKRPAVDEAKVTVLPAETVTELADKITRRYRAVIVLGAGSGVRISEALGLTQDRVDFLRRTIRVDRQLATGGGRNPVFAPVKDRKNRPRTVPVGQIVIDALAAHIATFGTGPEGLVFTNTTGGKVASSAWTTAWRSAAEPLGIPLGDGFHQLRHFYVSGLIAAGASVKRVQECIGDSSATITLDTYGHLWPGDDELVRDATDHALAMLATPNA